MQYYTGLKIKEACRLMESRPDMKVKELSDALSFSDQHYFSKVFKEYTGGSPTEYREKRLGGRPASRD
ncbi:HTH-type transcriptional activator Btr [compost metagenome]